MAHRLIMSEFTLQYGVLGVRHLYKAMNYAHELAIQGATGGTYSKGNLARSIYKSGPRVEGLKVTARIGSNASYARYVERGTRHHEIIPRGVPHQMLHFFWLRRGKFVRLRHVNHPGMAGKHFLLRSLIVTATRYNLKIDVASLLGGL